MNNKLTLSGIVVSTAILSVACGTPATSSSDWQTFHNKNDGYSISTPSSWTRSEEDLSGTVDLYVGDPDIKIMIRAVHNTDKFGVDFAKGIPDAKTIKTNDGNDAVLDVLPVDNQGNISLHLEKFVDRTDYTFDVTVPQKFYRDNEQTLMKVAKSLTTDKR